MPPPMVERPYPLKKINQINLKAIALGVCLIGLLAGGLAFYRHANPPYRVLKQNSRLPGIDWEHEVARHYDPDIINILLLGFDRTASRDTRYRLYRPDTILIASLNLRSKRSALVSIPRDSYVRISGMEGCDKINSAYLYGYECLGSEGNRHQSGLDTVLGTVQEFLGGVPIHYFIKLDMDAAVEIIDKLGGIDYEVEVQIKEPGSNRVLLDRGEQHLDGSRFLSYVRFRGVGGDLERIERQQNILISAFNQLRKAGRLTDLPALVRTLTERVETNFTRAQMAALARLGREMGEVNIQRFLFPGNPQYCTREGRDIFFLIANEKARVEIIKLVFGAQVEENPQIVLSGKTPPKELLYPPGNTGKSGEPGFPGHLPQDLPSEQDLFSDYRD